MRQSLLLLFVASCVLLAACGGPEESESAAPKRRFVFDSGGAHHLQGYGAWLVTLQEGGRFDAVHQIRDEKTPYAPAGLPAEQNTALWALIDAADLAKIAIAERPGVPDESLLGFRLAVEGAEPVEVEVWQNDLEKYPALMAIRDALRPVVEENTGVKPMF